MFILGFSAELSEQLIISIHCNEADSVTMWNGLCGPLLLEQAGKATVLQAVLSLWWEQVVILEVQFTEGECSALSAYFKA